MELKLEIALAVAVQGDHAHASSRAPCSCECMCMCRPLGQKTGHHNENDAALDAPSLGSIAGLEELLLTTVLLLGLLNATLAGHDAAPLRFATPNDTAMPCRSMRHCSTVNSRSQLGCSCSHEVAATPCAPATPCGGCSCRGCRNKATPTVLIEIGTARQNKKII